VTLSNDSSAADEGAPVPGAPGLRARRAHVPGVDPQRDLLIVEVVDEMTSWNPRERMLAFKSWLKGSLSLIHLHVLTILEADGPLPMSHLADVLDVSVASATGIVGRMEERGLVERRHDSSDRRVVLVVPTEAGAAVFRDMRQQRREHLLGTLGRLSETELQSFLVGLKAMRAAREQIQAAKAASSETAAGTTDTNDTPTESDRPR
jgi:DNA-binding MarR family transcriptional regulator